MAGSVVGKGRAGNVKEQPPLEVADGSKLEKESPEDQAARRKEETKQTKQTNQHKAEVAAAHPGIVRQKH